MLRAIVLTCGVLFAAAATAQQGFISISVNNTVITTQESLLSEAGDFDLADYADLASYQLEVTRVGDQRSVGGSHLQGGKVTIVKPLGGSSVLLRRAIELNETVSATVRFFGPNLDTGATMPLYTAEFGNGRVSDVTPWFKTPGSAAELTQLYEAVTFQFAIATFTHEPTSVQHQIDFTTTGGL